MRRAKQTRLEKAGWRIGNAADFLGLSKEEAAFVELKLALARSLRQRRLRKGMTQVELAKHLHSSQSRVAKMEAAELSVSIDLLVRSLLALGVSRRELGRIIATPRNERAA